MSKTGIAPDLRFEIDCVAGANIYNAVEQLCAVTGALGTAVSCKLNGIVVSALPGSDPVVLKERLSRELNGRGNEA